jgi:hypothetical protein
MDKANVTTKKVFQCGKFAKEKNSMMNPRERMSGEERIHAHISI